MWIRRAVRSLVTVNNCGTARELITRFLLNKLDRLVNASFSRTAKWMRQDRISLTEAAKCTQSSFNCVSSLLALCARISCHNYTQVFQLANKDWATCSKFSLASRNVLECLAKKCLVSRENGRDNLWKQFGEKRAISDNRNSDIDIPDIQNRIFKFLTFGLRTLCIESA